MEYTTDIVENLLRNYYALQSHPDSTFSFYKMDLERAMKALERENSTLYFTLLNVFVSGMPIQDQAYKDGVSPRQVSRRLHDGLYALTMIMNGEKVYEAG
jgi:hypothetical protein